MRTTFLARGFVASALLASGLALAACGNLPLTVPDTARLKPGELGGFDQDVQSVQFADWAFADAGRTYGRPAEAARAAAAMDYIAGQLYTSPRWQNISALTKEQLLQGRQEVRTTLGVKPGTSSQRVVDTLSSAGHALAAGDKAKAIGLLNDGVFDRSGEQVLATLSNMPYLQMANVATSHADSELFQNDSDFRF